MRNMSYFQDDDKNSDFLKNDEIPKSPLQERLEREEQEMQAKRHKRKVEAEEKVAISLVAWSASLLVPYLFG